MSKIEWTEKTWNPITGCSKVSPGCKNCYALRMSHRLAHNPTTKGKYAGTTRKTAGGQVQWTGKVNWHYKELEVPYNTEKPTTFFVCSMSDLFHEDVPFYFIDQVFLKMAESAQHTFQILTKRPERMAEYLKLFEEEPHPHFDYKMMYRQATDDHFGNEDLILNKDNWPLPNVWLGTSVEDQQQADERIPHLLQCPAAVRFLSCEPLLGPVELGLLGTTPKEWGYGYSAIYNHLNWVIAGGESGPGARPMHPDWVRSLRDQCVAADVPFFFKQWGAWGMPTHFKNGKSFRKELETSLDCSGINGNKAHTFKDGIVMERCGKKKAGNLLDGRTWQQTPQSSIVNRKSTIV